MKQIILITTLSILLACQNNTVSEKNNNNSTIPDVEAKDAIVKTKVNLTNEPIPSPEHLTYSWRQKDQSTNTLINRITPPKGFQRIPVSKGSFAEWLRYLPLHNVGWPVKLHNGSLKGNQNAHKAVFNIDVGRADLQQCADAVMRLKAEFHYGQKEYDKIHFNFTSGDKVSFDDWRKGTRPRINGNAVSFKKGGKVSDGYSNFREYMTKILTYAGTASLSKELKKKKIKEVLPGDVFIQGGFPGHAVLVLDVASNEAGERLFMVGQSYMPAQDFHLLKNDKRFPDKSLV